MSALNMTFTICHVGQKMSSGIHNYGQCCVKPPVFILFSFDCISNCIYLPGLTLPPLQIKTPQHQQSELVDSFLSLLCVYLLLFIVLLTFTWPLFGGKLLEFPVCVFYLHLCVEGFSCSYIFCPSWTDFWF